MNKISDFFYRFLKISVTIALTLLFFASIVILKMIKLTPMQINISVLLGIAIVFCTIIICTKIHTKYKIFLILAVAFGVRLVWILNVKSVLVSDFLTVYSAASDFLCGNKGALRDYGYLARFPHLVPMMVYMMGMIKVFGANAIIAMKCVSLLLSVLTVYLIYILSGYYVKKLVLSLIAMAIAAVYPSFVSYSSTFCTETIGVPLFILTVILFNSAVEKKNTRKFSFLVCGAVLYISNMFRGVGLVFLIAFSLYIFFFSDGKKFRDFIQLVAGYFITSVIISSILIGTGVIEQPLWKGKEPSIATLMLKGSNFEYNGTWNPDDAKFVTDNLKNKDLSKECFKIIGQRISEKNFYQVAGFYGRKFFNQWSIGDCSGTYWATMNTDIPYSYPLPIPFQMIYIIILLISLATFITDRKNNSPLALLMMLLCGFGVMFILLETQARYSYIVNWIFIILAITGLEKMFTENKYSLFVKKIYTTYRMQINYLIFGIVTTVVNIFTYWLLFDIFHVWNIPSTIVAWFLSVVVAYITNKIWVFESKSLEFSVVKKEIISFFSCRLLTGVLEVVIMWITVDILRLAPMVMKILVNIIVIVLNYIVSKLVVFNKKEIEQ